MPWFIWVIFSIILFMATRTLTLFNRTNDNAIPALILVIIVLFIAIPFLLKRARNRIDDAVANTQPEMEDLRSDDSRSFILYLRSFKSDDKRKRDHILSRHQLLNSFVQLCVHWAWGMILVWCYMILII